MESTPRAGGRFVECSGGVKAYFPRLVPKSIDSTRPDRWDCIVKTGVKPMKPKPECFTNLMLRGIVGWADRG